MKYEPKREKVYHNNRAFHPTLRNEDGSEWFMFYCSNRKANFYLNKAKATLLTIREDGSRDFRLLTANGIGCTTEFDLTPKFNRCVVSGVEENLTQHHVVPSMFIKYFPDKYKMNNSHDVLLLTIPNHSAYEREASDFKDVLAKKYNAPTIKQWMRGEVEGSDIEHLKKIMKISTIAHVIRNYAEKMPEYVLQDRMKEFITLTGLPPTEKNLKAISQLKHKYKVDEKYGEFFVPLITDYEEFCRLWREHFILTMNPQYLPAGWTVEGNKKT